MSDSPSITGGHNAKAVADETLRRLIERVERLEEEKASIAVDIKEVYSEAKSQGFNAKVMREVIKLRRLDKATRDEIEDTRTLYCEALGVFG